MNKGKQKDEKDKKTIVRSFYKAFKSFGAALPTMLGVILVLGLFRTFVSKVRGQESNDGS
jgi:hypothetical protein